MGGGAELKISAHALVDVEAAETAAPVGGEIEDLLAVVVFEEPGGEVRRRGVDIGPEIFRWFPTEVIGGVVAARDEQIRGSKPVADEDQVMAVGREQGAMIVGRRVDRRAEIDRSAPRGGNGVALRDPDILPSESAASGRGEVKTETSL